MELIVHERGTFIQKHQGRLRVMREKERLAEVPLLILDQVIIESYGVGISSDAVRACAEHGIPIHFLSSTGTAYASLYSAGLTGTVQTRRAQLQAFENARGAWLARAFVCGKLENQHNLLRMMAKYRKTADPACFERVQPIIAEMRDHIIEAERVLPEQLEHIRPMLLSIEGRGAARYWLGVRELLLCDLDWPGRETQGARDPLNSALNYGYGILYSQIERCLVLAGLDPYGGFMHTDRPGKPSLVLDLIEEFRQTVVDRTILGLVNRKMTIEQDETGRLSEHTREMIRERLFKRLEASEPYEAKRVSLRVIMQSQARHLATFVRGDRETYTPFIAAW
ncbi:CRISPR-associated endonuclease Cas1 [Herpetosiphon giganteus]|uniref:CRISPR-associated endonuclease Cas1 n=1 Tax=Herpetosiphon giganteus TaxID=2029754 RepID=UPI0019576774|nr:CRISPR-associated endonuclease Cas1 [Herpetosiphon giganteus]MBM7846116.1 CRISPR-associated protein Cas1 [Herpetosiphon giganteus]